MSLHPPIIVLADDLSGAAEVAGIAASRGLSAEVQRHSNCASGAQVLAIDSDTRSSSAERISLQMRVLAEQIIPVLPEWPHLHRPRRVPLAPAIRVYKKVDSLLRGHPRLEIETLLDNWQLPRALLIPANPSRGRTIAGGMYFIDGVPINETMFADDPEFPRRSQHIDSLLDPVGRFEVRGIATRARLPPRGIIVPDVTSLDDVRHYATTIEEDTLPAGAADFFAALLDHWCAPPLTPPGRPIVPLVKSPALLICGSHAAWKNRREHCRQADLSVLELNATDTSHGLNFATASAELQSKRALVLGTGVETLPVPQRAVHLRKLADFAALLTRGAKPATLLLEGGATAAAVADQLGWTRFFVQQAAASGVGVLQPLDNQLAPLVLIKPGSYPWPDEIWDSFCGLR